MDLRQVAMSAAIGAAVAVNTALQSLRDAGSFLIEGPSNPIPAVPTVTDNLAQVTSTADHDREEASLSRDFVDEEGDDSIKLLFPFSSRTSTDDSSEGIETNSWPGQCGLRKLPVKRKLVECPADDFDKAERDQKEDKENSSSDDAEEDWVDSNTSMNIQSTRRQKVEERQVSRPLIPPILPSILPPLVQSEELMSAMLQHTMNTVLQTLCAAKERREQILNEMRIANPPKEQTTLQLVNGFIDALVNVNDGLRIVHSALFSKPEDLQSTT